MADKALSNAVESASDSISAPEHVESSNSNANLNVPRTRYFFGHRGSTLMSAISFAGSVGFFLFGYDQGVLGVRLPSEGIGSRLLTNRCERASIHPPTSSISLETHRTLF